MNIGNLGRAIHRAGGFLVNSAAGQLGFGTGSGGAVTQETSASTTVVLSKPCGKITTFALTTAAAAEEEFTVTNTTVAATDVIVLSTTYAGLTNEHALQWGRAFGQPGGPIRLTFRLTLFVASMGPGLVRPEVRSNEMSDIIAEVLQWGRASSARRSWASPSPN